MYVQWMYDVCRGSCVLEMYASALYMYKVELHENEKFFDSVWKF